MFAPGVRPSPPTSPEVRSERMSPKRFVVTITSNFSGRITSSIAHASTILSSLATRPAYSAATFRPISRKRPCEYLRMLALCTTVTRLRPCFTAYSNA